MKNLALILAMSLIVSCGGDERPVSMSCVPQVNVTVAAERAASAKAKAAKPATAPAQGEVVQVFWDVSSSMKEFSLSRRASKTKKESGDDLTPVVETLDSSVLLRAHATAVEQYGVGETITRIRSAREALKPNARSTALHLVAEQIGTALAKGSTQAALIVSDLELDTPKRASNSDGTVCGGVPLPSTSEAGSLFGRCFENAILAVPGARTRTNLLVHVFQKSTHDRELFILLLATDREFGKRISNEVMQRLSFTRHVIFDSGTVASANVQSCTLSAPPDGEVQLRDCGAKCFEPEATIQAQCNLRRTGDDAWISSSGQGIEGTTFEGSQVRFTIPCSNPPGRVDGALSFSWQKKTPWTRAEQASVRDLFDSLGDAIIRVVPKRTMRISLELMQ